MSEAMHRRERHRVRLAARRVARAAHEGWARCAGTPGYPVTHLSDAWPRVVCTHVGRALTEGDARVLAALTPGAVVAPEFNTVRERYAELRLVRDASGRSMLRRVWFEPTFRVFTVTRVGAAFRASVGSWAAQDAERVARLRSHKRDLDRRSRGTLNNPHGSFRDLKREYRRAARRATRALEGAALRGEEDRFDRVVTPRGGQLDRDVR